MLLAIDIGNTSLTFGVFNNGFLVYESKCSSKLNGDEYIKIFGELSQKYDITGCILSSVVKDLDYIISDCIKKVFNISANILNHEILNNIIKNSTKEPDSTGIDRLVNVYAAIKLYKNRPIVVIDAGTASTFEIINSDEEFIGGIIMPGIRLQLESLNTNTSLLPEIKPEYADSAIGDDTKTSILAGVVMGHAYTISKLLEKCTQELGEKPFVILTGGFSDIISTYLKDNYDILNKTLTLQGLELLSGNF